MIFINIAHPEVVSRICLSVLPYFKYETNMCIIYCLVTCIINPLAGRLI